MKTANLLAVTAIAAFAAAGAHASVLFTLGGPTTQTASPGFINETFSAGAGAGELDFILDGFRTLDGDNVRDAQPLPFDDVFTLSLNGVAILSGAFNLGGGGGNAVFFSPDGSAVTPHVRDFGQGGTVDMRVPLNLVAGMNTLRFAYASVRPQGIDDEAWAIEAVSVTGPEAGGVPEPATWGLMLLGFGGLGVRLRVRRATKMTPASLLRPSPFRA